MANIPWPELLILIGMPLLALFAVFKTWQMALALENRPSHQLTVRVVNKQLRDLDGREIQPDEVPGEEVYYFLKLAPLDGGAKARWFRVTPRHYKQFSPSELAELTHKGSRVLQLQHPVNGIRPHSVG